MSTPVQIQILNVIAARLANITEANGYSTTIKSHDRATLTSFKTYDLPRCNYWPGADELVELAHGGVELRSFVLFIEYYAKTRDLPFTDVSMELGADLWIALQRDISAPTVADKPSLKLGRIVSGFIRNSQAPVIGEGQTPWCGVLLEIRIDYKIKSENPFTLIN